MRTETPSIEIVKLTLVVLHPHALKVLSSRLGDLFSLPTLDLEKFPLASADQLNAASTSLLGFPVYMLKWIDFQAKSDEAPAIRSYLLSTLGADPVPNSPYEWADLNCIDTASLNVTTRQCLAEIRSGKTSPKKSPWAAIGWAREMEKWVEGETSKRGIEITGNPKQLKSWQLGCVWQVPTSLGALYFKASASFLAAETALTAWLSDLYPKSLPGILAFDTDTHWLLMKEFHGTPLADKEDIEFWKKALSEFARMQIALSSNPNKLLKIGVFDRSLKTLRKQYDALLLDVTNSRELFDFSELEAKELQSQSDDIRRLLTQLEQSRVPLSVDHGDLHSGNIVISGNDTIFFDWSDGCLTHPFFSLAPFLSNLDATKLNSASSQDTRAALIESYLRPWSEFCGGADLIDEFAVAMRIANIHLACSYHHFIVPHLEQPKEWSGSIGFWLKKALIV